MNFNRRPKRIAGPGFNINVKFDFKQMAESRTNSTPHKLFPISRSDECYDIKEQELLVTRKENKMVDAHSHVFSSLNGYPGLKVNMNEDQCRNKILKDVYFIGVALTEYRPDQQGYEQQGSVAQVAGVVTMINESNDIIYPGQTLVMDIQSDPFNRRFTADKGIPREKRRLVVRPLTDDYENSLDADVDLNTCIVGKAYSHARPDERFEMGINIGHELQVSNQVLKMPPAAELEKEIKKIRDNYGEEIAGTIKQVWQSDDINSLKKEIGTAIMFDEDRKEALGNYLRRTGVDNIPDVISQIDYEARRISARKNEGELVDAEKEEKDDDQGGASLLGVGEISDTELGVKLKPKARKKRTKP